MSRLEDTHKSIKVFVDKNKTGTQTQDMSLSVIAQMLIEINETLAIMCDKMGCPLDKENKPKENWTNMRDS